MRLLLVLCFAATQLIAAEFRLATPFTENMVLQRDMPLPVWGVGPAGETVDVQLGDISRSAVVDAQGQWKLSLPEQAAGGQLTFQARCGDKVETFKNVMVGEVWICAGQSNMQLNYRKIPEIASMVQKASNIRCLDVPRKVSSTPEAFSEGQWAEAVPESAVAAAFACNVQDKLGVTVGIILTCWGSASLEGWMPLELQNQLPYFKDMMQEFNENDRAGVERIVAHGKWTGSQDIFLRTRPNIIYNQMMHPLIPYACRGLVWYQGEANTDTIEAMLQYDESQSIWLRRYRELWGQKEFHYLGVMLPGFGNIKGKEKSIEHPAAISWAWMRESQLKILELPDTGVATTIDLGDVKNIHPKDKAPIGERLTYLALRNVYGQDIVAEGPFIKAADVDGDSIRVSFNNAKGLRTKDGEAPKAFWLADDTGSWVRAKARIDGECVVLQSDQLKAPKYVRYAFAAKPEVNLVNEANLPARPFRTDTFVPPSNPDPGLIPSGGFRGLRKLQDK